MKQAERDLLKIEADMAGQFYEWACFTAHQSAKKAIKALYQHLHGQAWGHSLTQLIQALPPTPAAPPEVVASAQRLDVHYIPTRYPDGFPSGSPLDYYNESHAREALHDARRVIGFCQSLLP